MGQQHCCPIPLLFLSTFAQICAVISSFAPFRAVSMRFKPTKPVISSILSVILNWHRNCYLPNKANRRVYCGDWNFSTDLFENEQIYVLFTFCLYRKHFIPFLKVYIALLTAPSSRPGRCGFLTAPGIIKNGRLFMRNHQLELVLLLVGCTAPAHLVNKSEPTQDEKMQQTIAAWRGTHISKAIQRWGSPKEVNDDGTGWQTYIWHIPVWRYLGNQEHRMIPRPGQRTPLKQNSVDLQGVRGTYLSTDDAYQFTFYTRPNGIIYKTLAKKNQDPASELRWK